MMKIEPDLVSVEKLKVFDTKGAVPLPLPPDLALVSEIPIVTSWPAGGQVCAGIAAGDRVFILNGVP